MKKEINEKNNSSFLKKLYLSFLGIFICAFSNVLVHIFWSSLGRRINLPDYVLNFISYTFIALSIVGIVIAIYSIIIFAKRFIAQKYKILNVVLVTIFGVFLSSSAYTLSTYLSDIKPSFSDLKGHSIFFALGTDFAWNVSFISGITSIVFTAYMAYQLGKIIIKSIK